MTNEPQGQNTQQILIKSAHTMDNQMVLHKHDKQGCLSHEQNQQV